MNEVVAEILKRYGVTALAVTLAFGFSIWGLAHVVAAPSSEVSVLWGLVKYTKKTELPKGSNSGIKPSLESKQASVVIATPTSSEPALPAIELSVHGDLRQSTFEEMLKSIRSDKSLRQLSAAESGREMREISSGTYFYFLSRWLDTATSLRSSLLQEQMATLDVSRYRTSDHYVEIHYPKGENMQLILFVDETAAQKVARLSGTESHEITAALSPWGNANTMIAVPVDRVSSSRVREVELEEMDRRLVLDILLR
jgi:hypothetical protein